MKPSTLGIHTPGCTTKQLGRIRGCFKTRERTRYRLLHGEHQPSTLFQEDRQTGMTQVVERLSRLLATQALREELDEVSAPFFSGI